MKRPTNILASLSVLVGIFLLLSGLAAAAGYLGLPYLLYNEDLLTTQLGQMAAIFLGLAGGTLALGHGLASLAGNPSRTLWLPPPLFFWLVFAVSLGLGNLLLIQEFSLEYIFPFVFVLGAALPTLAVLAYAFHRLGFPLTWRQASLAYVAGCTLSIPVVIILESILPLLAYLLIGPLDYLLYGLYGYGELDLPFILEQIFLSPLLMFFLVFTALQAPIPEEFAKALGPALFGKRISNERQAFAVGLAAGAGFAILENMLYEGLYASWSGWTWGGITLLRAIGSSMHPLCSGIIALALFRSRQRREGWYRGLGRAYLFSVGLHTLWNGGFEAFMFMTGIDSAGGLAREVSFYGLYVQTLLVGFLVLLSGGLWLLLRRYTRQLSQGQAIQFTPQGISRRTLAAWALGCALVVIPIGAALGPAWDQIKLAFNLP